MPSMLGPTWSGRLTDRTDRNFWEYTNSRNFTSAACMQRHIWETGRNIWNWNSRTPTLFVSLPGMRGGELAQIPLRAKFS